MIGFEANTRFSTCVSASAPQTVAKYRMAYFAETVFPAPDSPDTMIDWFSSNLQGLEHQHQKKNNNHTQLTILNIT